HGRERHVAVQARRVDFAVDRLAGEMHAGRYVNGEENGDVVVLHVHAAAVAGLALVGPRRVARRIHRADRDATGVGHDLDVHALGIVTPRAFFGDDLHFVASGGLGADVAVDPLDLDRLPLADRAVPAEVLRSGGAGRQKACDGGGTGEKVVTH